MQNSIYYMRIGDLSKRSGVSRYSIHHYLRLGLLPEPHKKNKTISYYGDEHLERLNQIKSLREQGLALYVIQQMLAMSAEEYERNKNAVMVPTARQPRKHKELKKQEIIRAGVKIFSKKGYYHTSISDITDAMGIGKSTFYLYFRNKKELFFKCIDDIFESLWKEDFERIRTEKDTASRLRLRGEAFIRVYPRIRDILQMMRGASVGKEEGIEKKYQEIYANIVSPVINDLKKGMEKGKYKKRDPELIAYIMVGMIEAVAYRVHLDDTYSIEDGLKAMRELNIRL